MNRGSRQDVSPDDRQQCHCVSSSHGNQEAFFRRYVYASEDPLLCIQHPPSIVFPLPKTTFIDFHNVARTYNESISVFNGWKRLTYLQLLEDCWCSTLHRCLGKSSSNQLRYVQSRRWVHVSNCSMNQSLVPSSTLTQRSARVINESVRRTFQFWVISFLCNGDSERHTLEGKYYFRSVILKVHLRSHSLLYLARYQSLQFWRHESLSLGLVGNNFNPWSNLMVFSTVDVNSWSFRRVRVSKSSTRRFTSMVMRMRWDWKVIPIVFISFL